MRAVRTAMLALVPAFCCLLAFRAADAQVAPQQDAPPKPTVPGESTTAHTEVPAASPAPSKPTLNNPAFDILEYEIEGNSVLPAREIERAVTPFLGEKRHFSDVEGARKALEEAYQKAGYQTVFVDIPEQRIASGVVRLHAIEGRVGVTRVTGTRYFEPGQIKGEVKELSSGAVPDFAQMQQQLAQVNKSSDRQVAPILTAGRVPGTVDVNLSVKDTLPLHGDIEDDNHSSPFTTSNRASASIHYDNLWQRQHSLALNYQVSPQNRAETNVLYATYLWRFSNSENVLSVYGIRSNSNVAVVGSATILGNAKIAGARWIMPIGSGVSGGQSYFDSLTLGIDRKDFAQTNINAQSADLTVLPPISYYPLSLNLSTTLVDPAQTAQLSFGFVTAPRGLLGNSDAKFQSRRVLGNASYVAWKFDISVERNFLRSWSAYGHVDGQWTFDALIPNEQYITGGADSVRGYRESEISGDRGAHVTLEARYFPLERPGPEGGRSLYVCAFGDGAQVRLVEPAGPQISLTTIASGGFGVHAQGWHGVHFALDMAEALRDGGHGVSGAITKKGTKRLEALLGYAF